MIYPKFPKDSESIGICAPSAGVGHKLESFDASLNSIRKLGFNTLETESVRIDDIRPADGHTRAEEYHSLIRNKDVSSIIAATGGEYNIEVLPYLDSELIRQNPKWLCGYSDPTNILYYLTTKLDIASIYGFNAGTFDWNPLHRFQTNALEILRGNIIKQESFDYYDSDRSFGKTDFNMDTAVSWDLYMPAKNEPVTDRQCFTGRLIGGCTDIITRLLGTPYDGTSDFVSRYKDDGFIWYFDTFEMSPISLYCSMLQFRYAGMFTNAKAVIIGRVMFPGDATDEEYIEHLKLAFPDIPFIWGADIGHTKPCMTIINGSMGYLETENGKAKLNMELI